MERITDTYLTRDGDAEQQLCCNAYDALGRLSSQCLGGVDALLSSL